ncbi:MAG: DUF2244 domain-containing protein [Stellaceae bacterium]
MSLTLPPQSGPTFLDAVLRPYRSLPRRGFRLMMLGLASIGIGVGIAAVLAGAWPIVGFFALDVALVYLAFRLSYRSARQHECVRLTEKALTVERVSVAGARRLFRFEPYWARVRFAESEETNSLSIGSHGRTLVLGSFLAPEARCSFARQLADALKRWRAFVERRDTQ